MGTAVLFPQDCLRSRSRHKNQTPGMIYPLTSAPRSRRNKLASSQSLEAGLLPLPEHTQISFPMGVLRRGHDSKQMKATRKVSDVRERKPPCPPTNSPDLSVYLQRPKHGDSAAELLSHFEMLDKSGLTESARLSQVVYMCDDSTSIQIEMNADELKHRGSKSRVARSYEAGSCARQALASQKKDLGRSAEGLHSVCVEGFEHSIPKVGESNMKNVVEKKSRAPSSVMVAAQAIVVEGVGKNDFCAKAMDGHEEEEQDNYSSRNLARLRRTATEPLMTKQLVGRYMKKVMHISVDNSKIKAYANCHQLCETGVSLSCEERWAGPAYSSSPPPSSLPLPKLCLPHVKATSTDMPPLIKKYSASVYMESFREPSAPTGLACENSGAWDVAFATKSLRRLLNLDPF